MYMMVPISCALCLALLWVSSMIKWTSPLNLTEKMTTFECGFDPLGPTRTPFSTRFILLMMFFLIFDVETVVALPLLYSSLLFPQLHLGMYIITFFSVLIGGLFYEWYNGVLDWT
uniref:NADH-ubiquinone oxidoreductase chain 3 n=1 Tax=Cerion incanum TaxID=145432 RepID=A0A0A0R2F7_9EUPU|nr:NADH dehydrogenase subunit 3 [Cerion incanum]AIU94461.1 NADH dehydrogenase subunit 3 [Cerion incanum]